MDIDRFHILIFWSAIIGAIVWFVWLDDSKFRYEIQYDDADLIFDDKPRDCEFLTAPLGRKNCSYEKEVLMFFFSRDLETDEQIISYDEGETWERNRDESTKVTYRGAINKRVHVVWVKTED